MMRCLGLTVFAALLLLMFTQHADAASTAFVRYNCAKLKLEPCHALGAGWFHLNDKQCFKMFCSERTFADARERCQDDCGDLVTIHNLQEYDRILCRLFHESSAKLIRVWIGGKRQANGQIAWIDGTPIKFSRWNYKQPDNTRNSEDCMEMNWKVWGHWNDLPCSFKLRFVCAVTL